MSDDDGGGNLRPRQRRARIAEILRAGPASVEDLAGSFGVSLSTVRRDLERLSASGAIHRTYGGAVPAGRTRERTLTEREHISGAAKAAIGRFAETLVTDESTVLLDAGTTVAALAHHLVPRSGLTVVTNGLTTADVLSEGDDLEIVVLGGALRRISGSTFGSMAEDALRDVTVDVAFLGGDGVDAERGVSERTDGQAVLKRAMIAAARQVVVLADSSKLTARDAHWWARIPTPWTLVTDSAATDEQVAALREAGVTVHVVPAHPEREAPAE